MIANKMNLSSVLAERIAEFAESYIPVFKVNCKGHPYHAGTAFAVSFGTKNVLVTAKHVLERDYENPCDAANEIFVMSRSGLKQLKRFHTASLPLSGGELDLSVLVCPDDNLLDFVPKPISSKLIRRAPLYEKLYLAACGFPAGRNYRKGRELTRRPYAYFGTTGSEKNTRRALYDPHFYFSIAIDLKRVYRGRDKKVKAPNPRGISGGPVFVTHNFATPGADHRVELAGVVVARSKDSKHLICVRAEFVEHIAGVLLS